MSVKALGKGRYQFRMRVPPKLVEVFGQGEWKPIFTANDPNHARQIGEEWRDHYKGLIAKAKSGAAIYTEPKRSHKSSLDKAVAEAIAFFDMQRAARPFIRDLESQVDERDEPELARAYYQTRSDNYDIEVELDAYLAKANILIPKGSDLYKSALASFRPTVLTDLAVKIKQSKARKIAAIDTNDLSAFESRIMNIRESDGPDAPKFSVIYADFLNHNAQHHIRDHKGERAKFDKAVNSFIQSEGDLPVNQISKSHTKRFFELLKVYPKDRDSKSDKMAFKDVITYHQKKGAYTSLTTTTIQVWKRSLKRVYDFAIEFYSDQFRTIGANPFDIAAKYLKGRESVVRRNFESDELTVMFSHPMFAKTFDHRAWLLLLLLFHGARDGEFANKGLDAVKQERKTKVWYLEVGWSKGKPNRLVPIHQFILDQGFIADYVLPLKAEAAVKDTAHRKAFDASGRPASEFEPLKHWLFPQFKRGGRMLKGKRHASKTPSAAFSQWAGRFIDAIVSKDPTITLHSFRHTWITAATELKVEKSWRTAIVGHVEGEDGDTHDTIYTHLTKINLKKTELDKVAFEGFPYEQFKR